LLRGRLTKSQQPPLIFRGDMPAKADILSSILVGSDRRFERLSHQPIEG
jgi:hypothetical protein